ncbi:MAG: hypothetical protein GX825_03710 [Syntrophomonadaceae bacterium]|nr:hypothetical protein [Syntrophomonadaceae bacterium]
MGVISAGDEIVPVDFVPGIGQVRDVNSYVLTGVLKRKGAVGQAYGGYDLARSGEVIVWSS